MADRIYQLKLEHHMIGRIAFEAYNAAGANPGKTFNGAPVPPWESLTDDVREKWQAGAAELFKRLARVARVACSPDAFEEVEELEGLCETLIADGMPTIPALELYEQKSKS